MKSVLPLRSLWKMQVAPSNSRHPKPLLLIEGGDGDSEVQCADT